MRKKAVGGFVLLLFVAFAIVTTYGEGFGEVATGPCRCLPYSVVLGSTENLTWTLVNSYSYPLKFYIQPAVLRPSNGTQPIISYDMLNGTIPANQTVDIIITVAMPKDAPVNANWSGIMTAFASGASQRSGGSQIQLGTAKYIQITSLPIPTTTTIISKTAKNQTPSSSNNQAFYGLLEPVILAVAIIIAFVVGIKYSGMRQAKRSKKKR